MPRKPAAKLTAKEKEAFFIRLYIEQGAVEARTAYCERRAVLKSGMGKKILARKAVKDEIYRRMEPIRLQQVKQAIVTEAVQTAKASQQEDLRTNVLSIQRMKIDLEVLDHELMTMAVGLDMNVFPKEKLDALKAAYVVFGTLESGNTRRLIPPEHLQQNDGQGTYTTLFNRLALKSSPASPEPPQSSSQEVFDLIPGQKQPEAVYAVPGPTESSDEPVPPSKTSSNVIVVEVE